MDQIEFQHASHRGWIKELDYFQDEVKIFQNELVKVWQQNIQSYSIQEHIQEYRSILMKKLIHIDDYRHRILDLERKMAVGELDTIASTHAELASLMQAFKEEFETLKTTFHRFVVKHD
ncbi:MAG TPA: hypothetical protein P5275_14740 [Saprospiraceae bacterium]|nr:hypothetical protein [Saprospiraceae bacterium]MCB9269259.1 hypothetical protein [Lewinellaceae bacterium]HPG06747.1 hypothetical protein [Saprospiraceae bacterium]HPQ98701.1 hypothetical protein [Saprospiraceae bacterium]HQU52640.1 hypothetical protein [Saprospiraceae bacterium]